MDRTLRLVSKTSNEIFMLRYPRSILNFCDYDLAYFAESAIAVCNDALRDGELDLGRVTDLRNSLKDAHVYIEHHLRTTYDKVVVDCWIDYLCRRDNVGTNALWNRFLKCKTAFEKTVFARLCDYRYNKGMNEWLNLVRVQDYAKNKISFLFSKNIKGAEEAAARRNYFDLMFSVTAQELGCRIEELGVTQVFTVGRLPSAPFLFPNISKDIIRNVLTDFDYSEDYSENNNYGELSDQIAMDAFAHMKRGLAQEFDSYNISRTVNENTPTRIYMPCGLKAAVDLEIDALIESGGWLSRCRRCGRYFLRDSENDHDYCGLPNPGGKTCLEIFKLEHPDYRVSPDLEKQCREITDVMYSRVDKSMSLSEYESWKTYLDALKGKVDNGEIPAEELTRFISYSESLDLTKSKPVEVRKKSEGPRERVIKPFMPERIQRSELPAQKPEPQPDPEELEASREGFFTSPIVRQKSERAPISHIIRAGEQPEIQQQSSFVGFAEQLRSEESAAQDVRGVPAPAAPSAYTPAPAAAQVTEPVKTTSVIRAGTAQPKPYSGAFSEFGAPQSAEESHPAPVADSEALFDWVSSVSEESGDMETGGDAFSGLLRGSEVPETPAAPSADYQNSETPASVPPEPKPRVIRKNAAAISAYGRMSGTPVTAPVLERVLPQETFGSFEDVHSQINADPEPFKDIGSIFDGVEKGAAPEPIAEPAAPEIPAASSEPAASAAKPEKKRKPKKAPEPEPVPEWEKPTESTGDGTERVPDGFWTEERGLFNDSGSESELDMLKEKKRARSSKTRHLYEALMKEPEDNPNVRKKEKPLK